MEETIKKVENILKNATEAIENNEIYEHGYPEARLIPANHVEICQDEFKGFVVDDISEIIEVYLESIFWERGLKIMKLSEVIAELENGSERTY